jgi:hypothetical protein
MPDFLLLRRPLVEGFLDRLAAFTVDDWRQLAGPGYERQPAYLAAMERVHEALRLVGPEALAFVTELDERIDRLWRQVEGHVRHPTSTDLTGDFPWLMAKTAARALLLRHVAGLGAVGFGTLYTPFAATIRARALQSLPTAARSSTSTPRPAVVRADVQRDAPRGRSGVPASHEHTDEHTED